MNITRLQNIAYAEGFLEDYISEVTEAVENSKEPSSERLEQIQQVRNMWQVLSTGLSDLRRENHDFELKLMAVRNSLA